MGTFICRGPRIPVVLFPLAGSAIDLWFANNQYTTALTGVLSCSRASIGYAKNLDGTLTQFGNDTLRIGVGTGLLVEDARTNLAVESQTFQNSANVNNVSIIADDTLAPDGTLTADRLTNTSTTNCNVNVGLTAGTVGTISVYAKVRSGGPWAQIIIFDTTFTHYYGAYFNIATGTVGSSSMGGDGAVTKKYIETLADGWFRLIVSGTFGASRSCWFYQIPSYDADNGSTSVVNDSAWMWGRQYENASFSSSYVPTTTVAATRAANNIVPIGSLSTAIASATGSIIAEISYAEGSSFAANIMDSNGTNLIGFDATNHGLASIGATLATANTANRSAAADKVGIAWSAAGRSLVLNGGAVATDATAQTPNATQHLGSASGTSNFIYAYVKRLTVWTSKLTDADLQGFTAP